MRVLSSPSLSAGLVNSDCWE